MTRKPEIQYIGQFYVHGSEARALELQEKKKQKHVIDFVDLEHFALQILLQKKDGEYVPTKTALEYRRYFCAVSPSSF